jgi:hypothetical protein
MTVAKPEICRFCPQYRKTIAGLKCDITGKRVVDVKTLTVRAAGQEYEIAGRTFALPTDMMIPEQCPLVLEQVIGGQEEQP